MERGKQPGSGTDGERHSLSRACPGLQLQAPSPCNGGRGREEETMPAQRPWEWVRTLRRGLPRRGRALRGLKLGMKEQELTWLRDSPPPGGKNRAEQGTFPATTLLRQEWRAQSREMAARDCWGSRASVLLPSPEGRGFAIMLQRLEHSGPGEPKPAGSFGPRRHLPIQFRVRNPQRTPGFALHTSSEQLRKLILQETGPSARQRLRLRSSVLSSPHPPPEF